MSTGNRTVVIPDVIWDRVEKIKSISRDAGTQMSFSDVIRRALVSFLPTLEEEYHITQKEN